MILGGEYSIVADLNEDGVVNILDIIIYKISYLGTNPTSPSQFFFTFFPQPKII